MPPARRVLRDACRLAGAEAAPSIKVLRLLDLALIACDAERAFLIRGAPGEDGGLDPVVEACRVRRGEGSQRPSRSVARDMLGRTRAFVSADLRSDRRVEQGLSVRALELRRVLAAPLPGPHRERRVLVLDSRIAAASALADDAIETVEAFASLLGLVDPHVPGTGPAPQRDSTECSDIAGHSAAMVATLAWARRVARSNLPVLVSGETGSGKEGIARLIHRNSPRCRGPFVAFNCTALAETLVDAELFGSARGAYTGSIRDRRGLFRLAHGGTLLLDEVGDMPPATQAKLLRALQENRVRPVGGETDVAIDVRIIAATHRDLERRMATGRFRRDLFYRLAVVRVEVPPLRERMGDLPRLIDGLAPRLERETGCAPPRLGRRALAALRAHDWPGNVRELHAVLARAMLRSAGATIEDFHLGPLASGGGAADGDGAGGGLERRMIESALRGAGGEIAAAAREIGWTRQKLYRRLKALGLKITEA